MPTLTYKPSYAAQLTKKPRILEAKFGDGYGQRVGDGINTNPQAWALTYSNLTDSMADSVEAFFDSVVGVSFTWTPPSKSPANFIYKDFSRAHNGEDKNEIRVNIEQTYG